MLDGGGVLCYNKEGKRSGMPGSGVLLSFAGKYSDMK
jgi:hypothetical protein